MGQSDNGNRPKLTLTDPKPLDRSKPNSIQFITSGTTPHTPKLILSRSKGSRHKGSTYKLSVSIFFNFVCFLSLRPAKTARPILTIYTSNDAVSRKKVPFGGPNACKNFQGVHFSPKIGPGIGISSLYKTMNNFSTVDVIFSQISSMLQPGERN
jgi:hypothetical protein